MPSITLRQLRDTKRLKRLLRAGKIVDLYSRDKLIGYIVPAGQEDAPGRWPDFAARAREIIGDRILPGSQLVIEERGRY